MQGVHSQSCGIFAATAVLQLWRWPAHACLPVLQQLLLLHGLAAALHVPPMACCVAALFELLCNLPACCLVHPSLPAALFIPPCLLP